MKKKLLPSEILDAVENIRSETGVSKEIIFDAIKNAFLDGAKRKYGSNINAHVEIDSNSGKINIYRKLNVVEEVENNSDEISFEDAKINNKGVKLGDVIIEELPPVHLDRLVAHKMSSVILSNIKSAEREIEYNIYKDKIGETVTGIVKKVSSRDLLVWVGKTECSIEVRSLLPNEKFNIGDKITACIQEIRQDNINPQIILSRSSNEFLISVFNSEILECQEGLISIVMCAREAGFRSKVVVQSGDSRIDPVGACIGPRGIRVKAIMDELKGERIDIIEFTEDVALLIERAILPAKPLNVTLNQRSHSAEIIVNEENLSLAIGRKGQNVRLASRLTGYKIDIVLKSQKQEKALEKFNKSTANIAEGLNLDEVAAQVIVASGFESIESIVSASLEEIASIDGFDLETAEIVKQRAEEYNNHITTKYQEIFKELGVNLEILELPILTKEMIVKMAENGVKSITDVADLASDELIEILGVDNISENDAGILVMIARKYVYDI